jgi:hypothetical protein
MLAMKTFSFNNISFIRKVLTGEPGAIFTTPHFHRNLRKSPISYNVTLHCAGKARQKQTVKLIKRISKLRRKWGVVNTDPGSDIINFLTLRPKVNNFLNKLECLSLLGLSWLVYCLLIRPGIYPTVEHIHLDTLHPYSQILDCIGQASRGKTL